LHFAPLGGLERKRLDTWRLRFAPQSTIGAEVRGNEDIIALVSLGMGIAFVPALVLHSSPLKGLVRQLEVRESPKGYDISLCSLPHCLEQRPVSLFWQIAKKRDEVR
jgi:LysR family positive regulator for ilvC